MYVPRSFSEERVEVLTAFVEAHPFATLVSVEEEAPHATHLPLLWDPDPAPFGTLLGHVARPNLHARSRATDALAIFSGPAAYVSPSWYPAKHEHGKVVPTWNYVAVHATGALRTIDDAAWLRAFLRRLTDREERAFETPWRVDDAPESYLRQMEKGIVGVEIAVRRLEGKWKLGQHRSLGDRAGMIAGLRRRGDPASLALAEAMTEHLAEEGARGERA